jgi:lipoprotein-anchoring transpeptidase ErfK/SrfK
VGATCFPPELQIEDNRMMRPIMALALGLAFAATSLAPSSFAATKPTDVPRTVVNAKTKKIVEVKKLKADKAALKGKLVAVQKRAYAVQKLRDDRLVTRRDCKGFLQCLFGSRRVRVTTNATPVQYASLGRAGLSGKTSRREVDWTETKYPVGSLIVRTPERALYYISAKGEAIRYSVGVGREGMQWSGSSRIDRKAEWPSWTPPEEMIKREAAKGHIIPPFMEGGPGNPLGARALYIGGKIYRVHGTNNEASIGGAVSSGCIRMMNADVIDLYDRVKVGAKIYVYQ